MLYLWICIVSYIKSINEDPYPEITLLQLQHLSPQKRKNRQP